MVRGASFNQGGCHGSPEHSKLEANEIPDFVGRRYLLTVSGDVEVTATNRVPKLTSHVPQGINPEILLLDLTIASSGGFGGQIVFYRSVHYKKPTSGNKYSEVDILFGGKIIQRIRVGHPKSLKTAANRKVREASLEADKSRRSRSPCCAARPWNAEKHDNLRVISSPLVGEGA